MIAKKGFILQGLCAQATANAENGLRQTQKTVYGYFWSVLFVVLSFCLFSILEFKRMKLSLCVHNDALHLGYFYKITCL